MSGSVAEESLSSCDLVVIDGKVNAEPDVIPELVQWRGHWTFVNFHYPAVEGEKATDLLKLLRLLKADRRKHPHGRPR